jgi:hypothetical protein
MNTQENPSPSPSLTRSPLRDDIDVLLPAASYLQYQNRADGWSTARQSAFLSHLADNGVVADAARSVGMSVSGGYALRRTARGYGFDLGWEAALLIARRVVADALMTAAIKGETARWVREDGVTTYTRQNTRLSLTLLDRVNPASALPEVLAVVSRFNWFLQLIEDGVSAEDLWSLFFDEALPRTDYEARERVRACLLLSKESEDFEEEDEREIEYKSMEGPVPTQRSHDAVLTRHPELGSGSISTPNSAAAEAFAPRTPDQVRGDDGGSDAGIVNAVPIPPEPHPLSQPSPDIRRYQYSDTVLETAPRSSLRRVAGRRRGGGLGRLRCSGVGA